MRRIPSPSRRQAARLLALFVVGCAFVLLVGTASADDRQLFQGTADAPYIFALFDVSGSMASPGTCTDENCDTLGGADAPDSRLYQLKAALYDIVRDEANINVRWGFAKFNQIDPTIRFKGWLYERKADQTFSGGGANPGWWDRIAWPPLDDQTWFGNSRDSATVGASCAGAYSNSVANTLLYLSDFPKLGSDGTTAFSTWVTPNNDGTDYRIRVQISAMTVPSGASSAYTSEIVLTIRVRAFQSDCATLVPGNDWTETVRFVPYYSEDLDGIDFRDGNGQLPFDFIAREGTGTSFTTVQGSQATRNRWDRVENDTGGFHNYGAVCPTSSPPAQWEPNETTSTGATDGDSTSVLERVTSNDPLGRSCTGDPFDRGDVLPWDWIQHPQDPDAVATGFEVSTRDAILYRLAPNTAVDGEFDVVADGDIGTKVPNDGTWEIGDAIPDFRVARYFEDVPSSGLIALKSEFASYPPLIAGGSTPLAGMFAQLQAWAEDWEPCASDEVDGDTTYKCRERYAILLTDGIQTTSCVGDPVDNAADLYAATRIDLNGDGDNTDDEDGPGIRTIVVGFGAFLTGGGTTSSELVDIAAAGGTGTGDINDNGITDCEELSTEDPDGAGPETGFDLCATDGVIEATDKQDLVDALSQVVASLVAAPTSFATAAVPQSQSVSEESIFLATFIPADSLPYYPGKLFHFVRPVPLTTNEDGEFVPNTDLLCDLDDTDPESCLAWDANASMQGLNGAFDQVPDGTELAANDLKIGAATTQRRIYTSLDPSAGGTVTAGADDVGRTMGLLGPTTDDAVREDLRLGFELPSASTTATDASLLEIFKGIVEERSISDPDEDDEFFEFILGDIFHSDPAFVGEPTRLEFLIDEPVPVNDPCGTGNTKKYGCFFAKHRFRRHVVYAGSNDGQLHAFDAGEFTSDEQDGQEQGTYSLGTGQELFSVIPRALMPTLEDVATEINHSFRFDGRSRIDDVFIDPSHTGTPTVNDREWRTVLISGYREGGQGYIALDITQPDPLEEQTLGSGATATKYFTPDSSNYVPDCLAGVSYDADECGPVPYGTSLWEISADQPDFADLGYTWSRPNTGTVRIQVDEDEIEERFVAVFGGGYDPRNPNGRTGTTPLSDGRHLYIVDIETGQILYQRELDGSSIPSDPAAVDTNGDGNLDTIYIGTYGGVMYKVDISSAAELDSNGQVPVGTWDPLAVFCTGTWDSSEETCNSSRPLFFPPSVIFVGSRGRFALAFGTGDRDDLWSASRASETGRFYVILDIGWGEELDTTTLPLTESNFDLIDAEAAAQDQDRLTDPLENGYVLGLDAGEKVFAPSFALSGLLVFNSILPSEDLSEENGQTLCEFGGDTNIYTLFTTSGDALSASSETPRFRTVEGAVGNPFTEVGSENVNSTGDDGDDDGDDGGDDGDDGGDGELTEDLLAIRNELMSFFPANCRFSNFSVNVKAVRSDTGLEFIAPVPICVIEKNWKEL